MDKTLSSDLNSERCEFEHLFCACAFINPTGTLEKCSYIEPDDFSDKNLGEFWRGVKEHGDPMKAASDAHVLVDITGYSTQITSSLYPEHYASEMKRYQYLGLASSDIGLIAMAISQRDENEVRDKVAKLHTKDLSLRPPDNTKNLPSEINKEFIRRINAQAPSVLTGIDDLDGILGGMFMGELTILAGRPGIGKTSVATAIAQNIATKDKSAKVLMFSLEMDKVQVWARMACAKTSHSWKEIRSGRAPASAISAVESASKTLESELGDRLIIEDGVWDVPTMVSICANIKPTIVIVDHLSEIRWKDDNADEVKWFGRATKILRTEVSRRMHIPVLLLHQLNRGVEGRDNRRPRLSDLKWSGDLEAIADVVIMLYREDYYDEEVSAKKITLVPMEIWVKKNRQGIMNACAIVNFDTSTQKFSPARSIAPTTRLPMVDNLPHAWYNQSDD